MVYRGIRRGGFAKNITRDTLILDEQQRKWHPKCFLRGHRSSRPCISTFNITGRQRKAGLEGEGEGVAPCIPIGTVIYPERRRTHTGTSHGTYPCRRVAVRSCHRSECPLNLRVRCPLHRSHCKNIFPCISPFILQGKRADIYARIISGRATSYYRYR